MSPISALILQALGYASALTALYSFVHAAIQRKDAFTAADRRTKPFWMGVTGGATVACALAAFAGGASILWIVWIAGLVAALVYIVDVRPQVIEVQRGH